MATLVLTTVGTALGGPIGGALGSLVGQSIDQGLFGPGMRKGPRLGDLSVQTSSYGSPIPRIYGTMRVAGTVIWATDLKEAEAIEGGGKSGPEHTTYSYSANLAVALSSRPIRAVRRIWADGKLIRGAAGDFKVRTKFRVATGSEDQPIDPLIASVETIAETPAYRGLGLAIFEDLELAEFGNRIPMLTFEVEADEGPISMLELFEDASGGAIDVQDDRSVAGFAAHGTSVRDALDLLSSVCGVDLVECDGKLSAPLVTSPLPLDDDELGCDADAEGRPRIERLRAPDSILPSSLAMSYYDADRDYQAGQMRASAGGGRTRDERIELPAVLAAPEAKQLVEQALCRRWRAGDRLRPRLPPSRIGLRPGDAIQLPGSAQAWSIRAVSIEGMAVTVEAEAAPATIQPLPADAGRGVSEPDLVPGRTEPFLFELPDLDEAPSASIRVHVAASNEGLWKAVPIELSAGQAAPNSLILSRRAIAGRTETLLEPRAPLVLDELSSVLVRLINSSQALFNADMDGLMAGANVAVIGQEMVQFGRADLLEPGVYRLSHLLRGRRGTEWAAWQHAVGEIVCLLDPAQVRTFDLPVSAMGVELHGTAQGIGDIAPLPSCSRPLTGETMRPPSPCHLQVGRSGSNLAVEWVRRSYRGWHWIDGVGDGIDNFPELYRLTIQGPGGTISIDSLECSIMLEVTEVPAQAGQAISLAVATVGPSALSRPATASFIL